MTIKHIEPPGDAMEEMEATKDIFDCGDGDPWWLLVIAAIFAVALCGGAFWAIVTIVDYWRAYV